MFRFLILTSFKVHSNKFPGSEGIAKIPLLTPHPSRLQFTGFYLTVKYVHNLKIWMPSSPPRRNTQTWVGS